MMANRSGRGLGKPDECLGHKKSVKQRGTQSTETIRCPAGNACSAEREASGQFNRINRPDTRLYPTKGDQIKKVLANREPSTQDIQQRLLLQQFVNNDNLEPHINMLPSSAPRKISCCSSVNFSSPL